MRRRDLQPVRRDAVLLTGTRDLAIEQQAIPPSPVLTPPLHMCIHTSGRQLWRNEPFPKTRALDSISPDVPWSNLDADEHCGTHCSHPFSEPERHPTRISQSARVRPSWLSSSATTCRARRPISCNSFTAAHSTRRTRRSPARTPGVRIVVAWPV